MPPQSAAAARTRRPAAAWPTHQRVATLPLPAPQDGTAPHDLLILGVGGTGAETVGAVISIAAHLEGKQASVLDLMGFAQGAVRCSASCGWAIGPTACTQCAAMPSRPTRCCACDLAVTARPGALLTLRHGWQRGLVPVGSPRCNVRSP